MRRGWRTSTIYASSRARSRAQKFEQQNKALDYSELTDADPEAYDTTLTSLVLAFDAYRPVDDTDRAIAAGIDADSLYAALGTARQGAVKDEIQQRLLGAPLAA